MSTAVLALHGFLGQGEDWKSLKQSWKDSSLEWRTPSFFSSDENWDLSSFSSLVGQLEDLKFSSPAVLMGYSMGGRVALELYKKNPSTWKALILLSSHPGYRSQTEYQERLRWKDKWLRKFQRDAWLDLMSEWNSQAVFQDSQNLSESYLSYKENLLDRRKLMQSLEGLSLDSQPYDTEFWQSQAQNINVFLGEADKTYLGIYDSLGLQSEVNISVVPDAGHRLLLDNPKGLALQLARLSCFG